MSEPEPCDHAAISTVAEGACYREAGRLIGFALEVRVACRRCGSRFMFTGLPAGTPDPHTPTVSLDGQTLSVPMMPVADASPDEIRRNGTAGEA